MTQTTEKEQNTLSKNVYTIFDTVLEQFELPFSCSGNDLQQTMTLLVNDPASRYYGRETDFILYKIGEFSQVSGIIRLVNIVRINYLNFYVDEKKRQLQTIIQTLNYMPQGYYKMPDDRKKEIQESIDSAIQKYVENYVVPDMDVNNISDSFYKGVNTRLNLLRTQIESLNTNKADRDYTLSLLDKVLVNS